MSDIKAYNDFFFRHLFSTKNNERFTLAFINAVLEDVKGPKIKNIVIENPFNLPRNIDEKLSIVDVKCKSECGKVFHIEIQVKRELAYEERALYYWARVFSEKHPKNEPYKRIHPVISIHVLNHTYFEDHTDIHSIFKLRNVKHNSILTESMAIHFLEMPKLKSITAASKLLKWLKFFRDADKGTEKLKQEIDFDKEISEAIEEYEKFKDDPIKRDAALRREMWLRDQFSSEYNAREAGREEGRSQEAEKQRIELITKMIQHKFPEGSEAAIKIATEKKVESFKVHQILGEIAELDTLIKELEKL